MNNTIRVYSICLIVLVFGCKEKAKEEAIKEELIMVEQSEMAKLMNDMYAFNESLKPQIKEGSLTNNYPEYFDNINFATLTDPTDRDETFEAFSKEFISAQKQLFLADNHDLKTRYNNVVNACIACHNKKCVGPIPRIKKLLIN